jgi:hypothetical protein
MLDRHLRELLLVIEGKSQRPFTRWARGSIPATRSSPFIIIHFCANPCPRKVTPTNVGNIYNGAEGSCIAVCYLITTSYRCFTFENSTKRLERRRTSLQSYLQPVNPLRIPETYRLNISCFILICYSSICPNIDALWHLRQRNEKETATCILTRSCIFCDDSGGGSPQYYCGPIREFT